MQLLESYRELPSVITGTLHLSARTKLKCNSHFTIIVIMRHSLTFLQKLLFLCFLFLFSFSSANQSLSYFVLLFYFISSFSFAVSVIGTPEGLLTNHGCRALLLLCCAGVCMCACVCVSACCNSAGWRILGTYSSSSPLVTKTY